MKTATPIPHLGVEAEKPMKTKSSKKGSPDGRQAGRSWRKPASTPSTPVPHLGVEAEKPMKTREVLAGRQAGDHTRRHKKTALLGRPPHLVCLKRPSVLTRGVEAVNPRGQAPKMRWHPRLPTRLFLSGPNPHRVAAPHPAPLAGRGASGVERPLKIFDQTKSRRKA